MLLHVRRPVTPRRGRPRPGLTAALTALETAAFARAADGLIHDRATAPRDPARYAVLLRCPRLTADLALDHAAREAAHRALCHGWQVADLLAFARPRLDDLGFDYLADVLGLAAQWSAAPAWLTELDALGRRQWWTSGDPHATQWAERHGVDRAQLLEAGVDALALLTHLPHTAAALPDTPAASGAAAGVLVRESRVVARIDSLLARAVGTTFRHEAEACAAKAQELLLRYARPAEPAAPAAPAPITSQDAAA
ncbi:DUF2786 domain-containing protein [Jatrophihabitans endophyticus]|uniref:DUF2786 domain-containing protein n=1 Tax=Jatrophihabitans endophyticus TaxID=1206085 RepID=UPI0019DFAF39|nr:DUF2786 domain-containing protein [Jatrophihabitans endophyticus]MBE7188975.1 DUF2786 domain-containing protein [Jatrophihabitans endophyticus]